MLIRSLSSSFALVAVSLALSSQISLAADCSASITSFTIAGRGISGRELMYRITLQTDSDVAAAEFAVHSAASADVKADATVTRASTPPFAHQAWLTLSSAAAPTGVSLSSITKNAQNVLCAAPSAPPTPLTMFDGRMTVYDDSHPHPDLNDGSSRNDGLAHDANFKTKVSPEYPEMARQEGIDGAVMVEVEIGPQGGSPIAAWVRMLDMAGSGDGSSLAKASLEAARTSTFTAAVVDGRPQARDYLIIYTFSLSSPSGGPPSYSLSPRSFDDRCPLSLNDVRMAAPAAGDQDATYFIRVSAKSSEVTSAIIGIEDDAGHVALYPWPAVALDGPTSGEKYSTGGAVLTWPHQNVDAMWIDEATTTSCAAVKCSSGIVEPIPIAGAASTLRFTSRTTPDAVGIIGAPKAHFVREVWQAYPSESDGDRAAGHVAIDGIVDSTGHVVEAFVTHSSGLDDLDKAAMDAATYSTYAPASPGGLTAFETVYRFVP